MQSGIGQMAERFVRTSQSEPRSLARFVVASTGNQRSRTVAWESNGPLINKSHSCNPPPFLSRFHGFGAEFDEYLFLSSKPQMPISRETDCTSSHSASDVESIFRGKRQTLRRVRRPPPYPLSFVGWLLQLPSVKPPLSFPSAVGLPPASE